MPFAAPVTMAFLFSSLISFLLGATLTAPRGKGHELGAYTEGRYNHQFNLRQAGKETQQIVLHSYRREDSNKTTA